MQCACSVYHNVILRCNGYNPSEYVDIHTVAGVKCRITSDIRHFLHKPLDRATWLQPCGRIGLRCLG